MTKANFRGRRAILGLGLVATLGGCTRSDEFTSDSTDPVGSQAAPSSPFPWVTPRPTDTVSMERFPAEVVQTADSEAVVMAPLEARVLAVHVQAGDEVEHGDAIADVVMPRLETAVAEVQAATTTSKILESRRARLVKLRTDGLARGGDVAAVEVELARLEGQRRRAQAVLAGAGVRRAGVHTLRSPIDGVVVTASVRLGEVRRPDDGPLAVVRRKSGRRVSTVLPKAPDAELRYVFVRDDGTSTELSIITHVADASGFGYTTWFEARTELPASSRGRVELLLPEGTPLWQLPEAAVEHDDVTTFVVAQTPDGGPSLRIEVSVIRIAEGTAWVRGDLSSQLRVATDPSQALELQQAEAAP